MEASTTPRRRDDTPHWARPIDRLKITNVPAGATNLNLDGREIVSPLQGFGMLWQKTYRVRLTGITTTVAEVIGAWKENFPKFQPPGNHFYPTMMGIQPGEVLFIDSLLPVLPGTPGIVPIAAGVMVLYADDECFTVMTPEGFPESGWNTFSAYEDEGGVVAQVQTLARSADPIYELGLHLMGGMKFQDNTWSHVLLSLAAHFGVSGQVQMHKICLDPKLQWSEAKNIWYNAAIRTFFYMSAAPLRWVGKQLKG